MTARDLVVLVADKDMQHALKGLLSRPQAMGTRPIAHDIYVHPLHDPACARPEGVQFLSRFAAQYDHGLLLFDHEGSGCEATPAEELQNEIDRRLALSAWGERARAIVLDPELEAWVLVKLSPCRPRDRLVGEDAVASRLADRQRLDAGERIETLASREGIP